MQLKPIKLIVLYLFIQGVNTEWEAVLGGDNSTFRDSRVNKLISNSPWRGCNNNSTPSSTVAAHATRLSRPWDTYSICQLHRSSHCAICTIFVSGLPFCHREMKFWRALPKCSVMGWSFEWNWNVSCALFEKFVWYVIFFFSYKYDSVSAILSTFEVWRRLQLA